MSYQQKYLKYKNKYLGLKSKYGHLLNIAETETSLPDNIVPNNKLFDELNPSDTATSMPINARIVSSMYGGGKSNSETETATETTIRNTDNTEEVRKLFKQIAGAKPKKNKSKSKVRNVVKKHFFNDDSDLSDSTGTSSEAHNDSEFSSSDMDW